MKVVHIKAFEFIGHNGNTRFSFSVFVLLINVVINDAVGWFEGVASERGRFGTRHGNADAMNLQFHRS